jgi:hypothetical protein
MKIKSTNLLKYFHSLFKTWVKLAPDCSTGLQHCKYAARSTANMLHAVLQVFFCSTADLLQILHFCNGQFWFLNFAANLQHG